jgi:hypothetical protein
MARTAWKVQIPTGRWMAGILTFATKAKAENFIDRWNQVEVNTGKSSLTFYRDGRTFRPVPEKVQHVSVDEVFANPKGWMK